MFKQVAFPGKKEFDNPANLIKIGKSIVKKCRGLPLTIMKLGSMLCYETDENIWDDVLENGFCSLTESHHENSPALDFSCKLMTI